MLIMWKKLSQRMKEKILPWTLEDVVVLKWLWSLKFLSLDL